MAGVCSDEELVTVGPDDELERAVELMGEHAVRRVPVVDDGRPVGFVSLGDLALERDPEFRRWAASAWPGPTPEARHRGFRGDGPGDPTGRRRCRKQKEDDAP